MWIVSLLWLSPGALAAPACTTLEESEFRSYVLDAQAAIDRGDVELPAAILTEIEEHLPCFQFAPAPRMWADLMVAWAIVEFSRGGEWEGALAAALRIRPLVDRGVGQGHPLAHWEPPPPPPSGPPVPSGIKLYVDGLPSPTLPPSEGLYLVQKTDGRFWNTTLVRDTALPMSWVTSPVEQPPRIRTWVRVGVEGTLGAFEQQLDWASDLFPETLAQYGRVGASLDLQSSFLVPFGPRAHATLSYGSSLWADGWIAAAWTPGQGTLGLGVGSVSVSILENQFSGPVPLPTEVVERVRQLRYPMATAGYRSHGRSRWDTSIAVGGSFAALRYELEAGLLLPEVGGQQFRIGLSLDGRRGIYEQQVNVERLLVVGGVQGGIRLDWIGGEY